MALQDYTLSTIRAELAVEFGLATTGDDKTLIDNKINQAVQWVVRRRETWPWLLREGVINVEPKRTGSMSVALGTVAASLQSGSVPIRWVVEKGSQSGNLLDGYLVAGALDPAGSLDAQWLEGTTAGSVYPFTAAQAYFKLPDDFGRMHKVHTTDLPDRELVYASPQVFESVRRRQIPFDYGSPLIYTVVPDPLAVSLGNFFLALYPYPVERQNLHFWYHADAQELSADADVPLVPRKHRLVLFNVAAWMIAQKTKQEPQLTQGYSQMAQEALERMAQEANSLENDDSRVRRSRKSGPLGPLPYDFPIPGS